MNHNQRGVVGTAVIAFLIAAVFYIPWRVESTDDLTWAPFYRGPVKVQPARIEALTGSRYEMLEGKPVWWLYAVQLGAIAGLGSIAFRIAD